MKRTLPADQLLVKYGFIKDKYKDLYEFDKDKGYYVPKEGDYNGAHANQEYDEEVNLTWNKQYFPTGMPLPAKRYRMIYENFNMSMEEMYFWMLNHLRQDMGFPKVYKITDVFSASENSAQFGQSAQRMSIQEDRASSFLRGISEMVKTLFQIVRELRIIDERLDAYNNWKESDSADSTLKSIFIDFVENKGGQMQPGSVYHLSNQVGYTLLPDLFFNTKVYKKEQVDKVVNGMSGFNENVKTVLKRKLYQFIIWKEKTEKELNARKKFQVRYLRQHYLTIKTYMSWVKPYLRHIKRLTMNEEQLDSPDLITAFETSAAEIEIMGVRGIPGNDFKSIINIQFKFTTRPIMNYQQEMNRGPIHIGKCVATLRSYAWTDKQVEMYRKMKDYEDRELLGLVDDKLQSAMDMLGDDLEKYLSEAEKEIEDKPEKKEDKPEKREFLRTENTALEPFVGVFSGLKEIGTSLVPAINFKARKKKDTGPKGSPGEAIGKANFAMWMVYNNYKKAHRLLTW